MKKFEYKMFSIVKTSTFDSLTGHLNEFGKEGWEVVQMIDRDSWYVVIMKREIAKEKKKKEVSMLID